MSKQNIYKKIVQDFLLAVMAGISISFGCLIYMMCENKVVGAMFFSLGLFLVLTRKYNLFTGKVAYLADNKPIYIAELVLMWCGNLCGALLIALALKVSKLSYLKEVATTIANGKLSQTGISAFLMATFCGMVIYWSVEIYKTVEHEVGKYLNILLLIPFFIVCGFEHCVANMFYFIFSESISWKALLWLLIMTAGNTFGAVALRILAKLRK